MSKMKIKNGKLKMKRFSLLTLFASLAGFAFLFGLASCEHLQDSLSSEQKEKMLEETGSALINGKTWYFDGISTTDFSGTTGATLAINFSKKAAVSATREIADDGTVSYTYHLSGSMAINYTRPTGQSSSVTYKISEGKIILDASGGANPSVGEMSSDGKTFRLNMTPVCYCLDSETASGNSIDYVEVKLSGFVCDEGAQKGRSIAALNKKFSVKPFYDDDVIKNGVVFSTIGSTAGKSVTIPTKGSVSLSKDASVTFSSSDSEASGISSSDFTLGTNSKGLTISCGKNLTGKTFSAELSISGFVPELNASSYTRTFIVNFKPLYVELDGVLVEEAWTADAVTSDASYANPSGYNLSKVYVANDDTNLYVAVEGNFESFVNGDNIVIMIDDENISSAGISQAEAIAARETEAKGPYCVPATNITFSSVDFYLCHILANKLMQSYRWVSDSGRTDMETSFSSLSDSVIEYKIPLSVIGASSGDNLKIFLSTSSYKWIDGGAPGNRFTVQDCIPSAAASVSNGGQSLAVNFANALSYTLKASE